VTCLPTETDFDSGKILRRYLGNDWRPSAPYSTK
jgi:hypothetical protein